jgi:hypothetical protein
MIKNNKILKKKIKKRKKKRGGWATSLAKMGPPHEEITHL